MGLIKILHLEDSDFDAEMIQRELKRRNIDFVSKVVDTRNEFEAEIKGFSPDLILSDHSLPQFNSLEALKIRNEFLPGVPFILITGSVSEEFAVECMKQGADDYILKNNLIRLASSIENVLSKSQIKKEKEVIKSLHGQLQGAFTEIKKKNKDINDSINYAKRIQQDMLPELGFMQKEGLDHMLVYKPKDVLSGDFYWVEKKDEKIFIAVADCTGHGVPGALLSMSGHNIINEIINMDHITDPAEILNHLNERFRKILKQETTSTHDGMEIGLCVLDLKIRTLEYAGARIPLYHNNKFRMEKIRPDKVAIGGAENNNVKFTKQTIKLEKGDRFFMFSDGITDQFNGTDTKKITRKLFERILRIFSIETIDTVKQEVLDFLANWKGKTPQTDDILIFGIEIMD